MRFSLVLAGAFAALAYADATTTLVTSTSPTVGAADPAQTSEQAAITDCLNKCAVGDVGCQSHCIAVPNPSPAQANATNECIGKCPVGNGTAADIENYKTCRDGCIAQFYYTTSGTPEPTGAAGGNSGSGSGSATTTGTDGTSKPTGTAAGGSSASGSGTATGSAPTTSTSKAAGAVAVGSSAVGLLGVLAAMLAL